MYNLFKFIAKYHFFLLFLLLEIISLTLVVQYNNYQKAKFMNSANAFTGNIYTIQSNITGFFKLKKVNEQLAQENAYLKSVTKEIHYVEVPMLTSDSIFLTDTLFLDTLISLNYIPAKVISNTTNKQQNIIFINKGKNDGLYENMGVVNQKGVVGVVRNISNNYATVVPIINTGFNINAKIKDSGFFGNLTWDGVNPLYAQLYDIPNHISPQKGDTIVTSGYSKVFEDGNIIGYIENVETVPGKSFIMIQVKLAVSFGNLNYVYALQNNFDNELDSLSYEN